MQSGRLVAALVAALVGLSSCGGSAGDDDQGARATTLPLPTTASRAPADDGSTSTTSAAADSSLPPATAAPTTSVDVPAAAPLADANVALEVLVSLEQPIDLAARPGDEALYIAEKTGRVRRVVGGAADPDPWIDLSDAVSTDGERGLLGIAFGPDGRFYASTTDRAGTSTIASWAIVDDRPDPGSAVVHLAVPQPFSNHNGGDIEFGPDGHLYIALGDGGSGGDPLDSGQDLGTVLGAILRIQPTESGYDIPADNPFVDVAGARHEIWVYGLRNPWRFSFDPATGDMWIGDVGQGSFEEIDRVPAGTSGLNFGWNIREGNAEFAGGSRDGLTDPVIDYGRSDGVSVSGGLVVRSGTLAALEGAYLYADFGSGFVRALRIDESGRVIEHAQLLSDAGSIAGFGRDTAGNVYVLSLGGTVSRLVER